MKYLAICLLSVASLFTSAGASPSLSQRAAVAPVSLQALAPISVNRSLQVGTSFADRALAGMVAAVLVGIQLRRRQKSLRMPRPFN
jgi:hypothetical protein